MNALNFYAEKPPFMNISLHKDVTKRQDLVINARLQYRRRVIDGHIELTVLFFNMFKQAKEGWLVGNI